jgi:hypothetical protein
MSMLCEITTTPPLAGRLLQRQVQTCRCSTPTRLPPFDGDRVFVRADRREKPLAIATIDIDADNLGTGEDAASESLPARPSTFGLRY